MSSHNYDKIVKLACKPKNALPKSKYIDVLIAATYADDNSLNEIIRSLSVRLRETNGVVVFKALLTLHQMIRTGSTETLLDVLSRQDILKLRSIERQHFDGYMPPASMGSYAVYLEWRIRGYRELKYDVVRVQAESNRRSDGMGANSKARRLRHLPVEKGLLREVKQVQKMLDCLIDCKFYNDDLKDENTVLAFRLLIKDLLVLFQAGNEGVCNILEHYFEMSKVDAKDAFDIYKSFIKQTDRVVDFLGVARKLHHVLNVPVPNLKHAPTGLVKALEEYLNDPNFEQNRLDYKKSLGVVEGKGGRTPSPAARQASPSKLAASSSSAPAPAPVSAPAPATQAPPGSSQKIQDFFESIQSDAQPTMFGGAPQQMNYAQMTVNQQQQQFNPFRQSMMMPQQTGFIQPQMTGFPMQQQQQGQFGQLPQQQQPQQQNFLQPQQTGQMAFGRQPAFPNGGGFLQPQSTGFIQPQAMQPQQTGFLQPQATGSNPFRQSMMMLNTGGGPGAHGSMSQPSSPFGQHHQTGLGGGLGSGFGGGQGGQSSGQGQIQRPGSTPAFGSAGPSIGGGSGGANGAEPKPLTAQATGSKNPFAPAPGSTPAKPTVQPAQKGPTMNELLMGYGQNQQGQGSQWGGANGQGQHSQGQMQPQQTGMGSIASQFTFDKPAGSNVTTGNDFLSQFGSMSVNGTGNPSSTSGTTSPNHLSQFGSLSSNPTGATSTTGLSSQQTGASSGFLQPQQTGFGGSAIKPFKPTSSFGSQLMETLPPIQEPGASGSAAQSPAGGAGVQPQSTGFPGFGGAGGPGALSPQMTGANPFRQSTMFGGAGGGAGAGGAGLNPQITGMGAFGGGGGGAFGASSPFAGQNQRPGQQQAQQPGLGQFGMFGQGQAQQNVQQGSLI
ncbi:hypothetical protein IAT38_005869 [Cryptococcus sp. DSM 104549]